MKKHTTSYPYTHRHTRGKYSSQYTVHTVKAQQMHLKWVRARSLDLTLGHGLGRSLAGDGSAQIDRDGQRRYSERQIFGL